MAFFFKSSLTATDSTSDLEEVNSAGVSKPSRCLECGFQFQNDRYKEDHRRWHEHVRCKGKPTAAITGNTENGGLKGDKEMRSKDSGMKIEKPDDSDLAECTSYQELASQHELMMKPFACEYCGWRFLLKKDMVHHVRTHTGEKPYHCSECGKRFARAHSLKQHKKLHAERGKPFSCAKCQTQFWTKSRYIAHCKNAHNQRKKSTCATLEAENSDDVGSCPVNVEGARKNTMSVLRTSLIEGISPPPWNVSVKSEDKDVNISNTQTNDVSELIEQMTAPLDTPLGGGKRGIRFTCQFCGWGFWDKKDKKQHEWTHTGYKPYRCTVCGKNFSRTYTLKLHMRSHTGERPYSCPYCDKTFAGSSSMRLHTKVHTKIQRHKCTMCLLSFKRMADFKEHQREHLNSDPVMFARCYSSSAQSKNLRSVSNEGVSTYTGDTPLPISLSLAQPTPELTELSQDRLEITAQVVSPKSSQIHHTKTLPATPREYPVETAKSSISPREQVDVACIDSDLSSPTAPVLPDTDREALINRFSKLISGPKRKRESRFLCQFCNKGFHDRKDCRQHENTHTGFKPYECSMCGKRLSRHYSLKVHMMTHTGNRPYRCSYCNLTFRDRTGRRAHEIIHTESHSYQCKLCQEKFHQAQSFSVHLQAHEKENPELVHEFYPDGFNPPIKDGSIGDQENPLDESTPAQRREQSSKTKNTCLKLRDDSPQGTAEEGASAGKAQWKDYRRPLRFNCSYCSQRFRDKKDWRQHENTHTGFKPYTCKLCGKKLSRQYTLKKHMLMHSGERPIACSHCKKTFRGRSALSSHLKNHHPWVLHRTCCICKTTHKGFDDLENHLRIFHANVVITLATNFLQYSPVNEATSSKSLSMEHDKPTYQSEVNMTSDLASREAISIVRFLSRRNQQVDPTAANAINNWLKLNERKVMIRRPKFECNFCSKGFGNRKDWQQHENSHTGYKPYTCNICGKKLSRLHTLKLHLLTHHSKDFPFVCRRCGKGFKTKMSMVKHEASRECETSSRPKTPSESNKCVEEQEADKGFQVDFQQAPTGPFFFKHEESNSTVIKEDSTSIGTRRSRRRHQCTYCGWRFSDFNVFRRHCCRQKRMLGKSNRKKISCQNCEEVFTTKEKLDNHLRTCGFTCSLCNKYFKKNEELISHLQVHASGNAKVNLLEKDDQDDSTGSLSMSTDVRNQDSGVLGSTGSKSAKHVRATCRVCHKTFSHRYALKLHLMMHASEIRYECRLCIKHFSSKKGLREHAKTHPQTDDVSANKDLLKPRSHLLGRQSKSKPKPHQCVYCGWGFWTKSDCVIHERTHIGEKPYLCETCGKSFNWSYSLKMHTSTHGGVKPFRCSYCNKGFSSGTYVKVHERIHSKENTNGCKRCGELFPCSSSLARHEQLCGSEEVHHEPQDGAPRAKSASLGLPSNIKEEPDFSETGSNEPNSVDNPQRNQDQSKSKPAVCVLCGWKFRNMSRMQRHTYWHRKRHFVKFPRKSTPRLTPLRGRKSLKCSDCEASFDHPVVLKIHLRSHTGEKPYRCKACFLEFSRYPLLLQHNEINHDLFHCRFCEKYTKGKQEAIKHKGTCRVSGSHRYDETDSKNSLRCRRCDKTFRGRQAESFHASRVHSRVCPFSCVRCHKGFESNRELMSHLLSDRCSGSSIRLREHPMWSARHQSRISKLSEASSFTRANYRGSQVSKIVSSDETQGWIQLKDLEPENQEGLILNSDTSVIDTLMEGE